MWHTFAMLKGQALTAGNPTLKCALSPTTELKMIKTSMIGNKRLPLVIDAEDNYRPDAGVDSLISLYVDNKSFLREKLLAHGGLLFRGFSVKTQSAFETFVHGVAGDDLFPYIDGTSPRTSLSKGIYTSTEYPQKYFISLHNELSYTHKWPSRIFFCCITAARQGGETPIADSRSLLRNIAPQVVRQFKDKHVKYVRNLHGGVGFGLSWQQVFETEDKSAVENYCREGGLSFKWKDDGGLWLSQVRPAVATHPQTGEEVWFNQADQFHPTEMDQNVYAAMMSIMKEEDLPKNAYFGDGSPLDTSMLDHIREVTRQEMVLFPWQEGDVLIIDNMLTAHGRMPFVGPRRILVAMA